MPITRLILFKTAKVEILITNGAYRRLAAKKAERESFSDVVLRITGKVKLSDFAGVLSRDTAAQLERRVSELRNKSRARTATSRLCVLS